MNEIGPGAGGAEVTQPSIYTDRRALSEAWYRALYDGAATAPKGPSAARGSTNAAPRSAAGAQQANREASAGGLDARHGSTQGKRVRLSRFTFAAPARSLAVRAAAAPTRTLCRNGAFRRTLCRTTLADGQAVDLLVQQRGDVLRLVAIYDGRSASRVAAALNRARVALAQRGLHPHIDAIQKGSS